MSHMVLKQIYKTLMKKIDKNLSNELEYQLRIFYTNFSEIRYDFCRTEASVGLKIDIDALSVLAAVRPWPKYRDYKTARFFYPIYHFLRPILGAAGILTLSFLKM